MDLEDHLYLNFVYDLSERGVQEGFYTTGFFYKSPTLPFSIIRGGSKHKQDMLNLDDLVYKDALKNGKTDA